MYVFMFACVESFKNRSAWTYLFDGFCWVSIGVSASSDFGEGCEETRGNVGKAA